MAAVELKAEAVRSQLEDVLRSPGFARNERLSRFLRFLVERHLEGRDRELKESVIGIEVFGRKPGYNPKFDPIVRTEARRLRARLDAYYEDDGKTDAIVIKLPKGGYVPIVDTLAEARGRSNPMRHWLWSGLGVGLVALTLAIVDWVRLAPASRPQSKTTAEAYDLYLRARAFQVQPSLRGIQQSLDLFQQAIAKDSSFAPAYAGIAAVEAAVSAFDRFDPAERGDMIVKGWAAAEKAIQLNPRLGDAHAGLGMMQARQAQWGLAERSFRRAVELAPRDPLWRDYFALFLLLPLGRIEEALGELRAAEELDPLLPQTHSALTRALTSAGRFAEAEVHCQMAAANDQDRSVCWAQTLLRQGKTEQAVGILEAMWSGHLLDMGAEAIGVAYARAGRREDAERIASLVPRPASKAAIFAALGDRDGTFEVLDQMASMGPTRIGRDVLISPDFSFLRGDPRLKTLRKKVGLPE